MSGRLPRGALFWLDADALVDLVIAESAIRDAHAKFKRVMGSERRSLVWLDEAVAALKDVRGAAEGSATGSGPVPEFASVAPSLDAGWITVAEAAERLGLGPRGVRRALKESRLDGYQRVAGSSWWLVNVESVDRWLARKRAKESAA